MLTGTPSRMPCRGGEESAMTEKTTGHFKKNALIFQGKRFGIHKKTPKRFRKDMQKHLFQRKRLLFSARRVSKKTEHTATKRKHTTYIEYIFHIQPSIHPPNRHIKIGFIEQMSAEQRPRILNYPARLSCSRNKRFSAFRTIILTI